MRLVGSGVAVGHSVTFVIVLISQHWYPTVDHVIHLTIPHVRWSVRMVITDQEIPPSIVVALMVLK